MINNLINFLLPSIEHYHVAGYWLAFFAALLETTFGIGLLLPGSTIILFLGALSARGYLDTGDLIWFAVVGAILGDNINYYLGRRYGPKWMEKGYWFLKSDYIDKTRNFMETHGAKSVFLGRFVPSVKEIVPFVAGSVKMNKRTFMFWNVLGAVGWGFEWVLAGYIFAQSLNLAELWLSRAGLFFAFLLIISAVLYVLKRLIIKQGKQFGIIAASLWQSIKKAVKSNEHVARWVNKHPRSMSFLKARFDTQVFSGLTLSILTLMFVYVFALFAGIVEDLVTSDPIIAADIRIANLVTVFRTDALTKIFSWVTLLGKSQVVLGFIAVAVVILWLWRKNHYIVALLISVCGSEAFTYLGKLTFHRPRPGFAVYAEHSFSFPSGHATIAVALYGFLGYLIIRSAQSWNKKVNIFFATLFVIIAIGFSRIYLGEHYISDVWSGYLVGGMWLIIAASFSEWLRHEKRYLQTRVPIGSARPISLFLVAIAMLFYILFSINYHPPLAVHPVTKPVTISSVLDVFKNEQMKFTETLIGDKQEPINFIFLSQNDDSLVTAISDSGWILADKADISSFIQAVKALIQKTPHPSAPMSPSFWNARVQDMSFAKVPGANWLRNAHHLKVWHTNFLLKNGNSIYVGSAKAHDGLKWGMIPKISPDLDEERERLYARLRHTGKMEDSRKAQFVHPFIGKNFIGDPFFTDGKAYVITIKNGS